MRLFRIVTLCLMMGVLTGCTEPQAVRQDGRNLDVELVKTLNNVAVENAIVTQHTIYPYHFVADAGELNELGQRDLTVLANHFKDHPGILNVHRGDAPEDLYNARVADVVSRLKATGVEMNRMSVSDGMPGGSGMTSERVITILQAQPQSQASYGAAGSTGMVTR